MNTAALGSSPKTVLDLLNFHARNRPFSVALRSRESGTWVGLSWADYARRVADVSAGLISVGVQPGDRVALISSNRKEWHIADLAVQAAGAVCVPGYLTSSASQLEYLLRDAGVCVAIVEHSELLAKILLGWSALPALTCIVMIQPAGGLDNPAICSFADLEARGSLLLQAQPDLVRQRTRAINSDDMATLVYTSGTTGPPKGAMITHANILATLNGALSVLEFGPVDRLLSFLPLSHIAERMVSHFGQLAAGAETWFARSLSAVPEDLRECRPTVFFAVPRVWEKLMDAVLVQIASQPRLLRGGPQRYLRLASERRNSQPLGKLDEAAYQVMNRTMGRFLRSQLGLDKARILASAAAPIHLRRLEWFASLGLPIAEVWGQTEDCGPATVNPPSAIRNGTVGKAIPGVELRLGDDHEVFVRGATVCAGYYGNAAASRALIDADGWMATGDLGDIDADGYLTLTGRKKDLIILSSGKNISPQVLETLLETDPLIGKAVIIGDGRPYLVALLSLDSEAVADWAHRPTGATVNSMMTDTELNRRIAATVASVNGQVSRAEGIKRWHLLSREFTVDTDELTPTLKVKRQVVSKNYLDLINALYEDEGNVRP